MAFFTILSIIKEHKQLFVQSKLISLLFPQLALVHKKAPAYCEHYSLIYNLFPVLI